MLLKAKNRLAHVPTPSLKYDDRIVMTASKHMSKKQQFLQDELKVVLKNKTRSKIDDEREDKIRARMKGKKVADKSGTTEERKLDRTRSMAREIKPKKTCELKKTQSLMATMRDSVNSKNPYQRNRHFRSYGQRNKRSSLPAVLKQKQPPTESFKKCVFFSQKLLISRIFQNLCRPAAVFKQTTRSTRSTPESIPENSVVSPQNSAKCASIKYVTNTDSESSDSENEFDDFDIDSGISSRSTPTKQSPPRVTRRGSLLPPLRRDKKIE